MTRALIAFCVIATAANCFVWYRVGYNSGRCYEANRCVTTLHAMNAARLRGNGLEVVTP